MKVLGTTGNHIIMVTLWVLFVKCKAQGNTKEAILCKYSRQAGREKTVRHSMEAAMAWWVAAMTAWRHSKWQVLSRNMFFGFPSGIIR